MLAAVSGVSDASRRLSEMLLQQQAFFGGYYSGICTVSDNSFHLQKCVGSHVELMKQASPLNLPGTSGIAHSRTNGGGSVRRAQPFVDCTGMLAGMGTGTHGIFRLQEHMLARQRLVDEIYAAGVQFNSTEASVPGSAKLPDGSSVHNSEMVVQAVAQMIRSGSRPSDAIRQVFNRVPSEGAYIFLLRSEPHKLYIANYNMRLVYSASVAGVEVATSPWALKGSFEIHEVPANTLLIVEKIGTQSEVLDASSAASLEQAIPNGLDQTFLDYVRLHPRSTWATIVDKAIAPRFPTNTATLIVPASFQAAERLLERGILRLATTQSPGAVNGIFAPQLVFEAVD